LYFAGRLVLQGDTSSGEGVTTVTDRLGSVVQTSRNVGGVADYDYYPYGGGLSGLQPNQTSFATYEVAGTSMLYAKNRFYDSARGRFTSTDPYDGSMDLKTPLSFNRYAYVMGDPINSSDPSGLCTIGGVVYPDGLPPCPDITGVTVYGGGFGSFGGGGSGGGTGGRNTLTPSQLQMQMADTHPGYVPVYISPKVETITSCETGVVYAGIAAGIATALGVGPPGSDPSNDLAQEIAKAVGNPSAGMQVSGVIYSALRTLLTGPAAAEISAYIGADLVPVAGWAATGYLVYEAVMGYKDYYESHIGSCHH
jgi:RHS repeat-associated protein